MVSGNSRVTLVIVFLQAFGGGGSGDVHTYKVLGAVKILLSMLASDGRTFGEESFLPQPRLILVAHSFQ